MNHINPPQINSGRGKLEQAEAREWALARIIGACQDALRIADEFGFVVTIEQIPKQPLAMGNYETFLSVRNARGIK